MECYLSRCSWTVTNLTKEYANKRHDGKPLRTKKLSPSIVSETEP